MKIYSFRYMWFMVDGDKINFKIVTDTVEGLELFEKKLLALDGLSVCGKEYLCEYDCSQIANLVSLTDSKEVK